MAINVMQRYEMKYLLDRSQTDYILQKLEGHMQADEYGLTSIASLYYDTPDARLGIVGIDAEADAFAFVFHAPAFHQHTLGHQVVPVKKGSHPVEHMVFGFLHIVCHQIFKGQHTFDV